MATFTRETFKPRTLPPEEQFQSVCCDVIDLGMVEREWQGKSKVKPEVKFVFQLDKPNPDFNNEPFRIYSRAFTNTLYGDKGKLKPFLEAWLGRSFTAEECKPGGFDLDYFIGMDALLNVVHNPSRDGMRLYANIGSIAPIGPKLRPSFPKMEVVNYVRMRDRAQEQESTQDEDDAVPF